MPLVEADDITAVVSSMQGQFLTQGPQLDAFENELAQALGAKHVIVCNSATAGLHLAYMALDLGPAKGLMTSPVTFLSTANAARMCGAPVFFSDVDPETGNMTSQTLGDALAGCEGPVGAIAPVHLCGRACDMASLQKIAHDHGAALIEDAAHAPLATYFDETGREFQVGACAHSDAAVFSFHAIKHIAMGEGGAVATNDAEVAARCRSLRSHGMVRDHEQWENAPEPDALWYYEMSEMGWNYRASEMQCALGRRQLAKLDSSISRRREIADLYYENLAGLNHLTLPLRDDGHVYHLYPLAIDFEAVGKTRGQIMRELAAQGVGTQVHYIPLYKQPYYARFATAPLAGAERYYAHTLSIPMYAGLSDEDVVEISHCVRTVIAGD